MNVWYVLFISGWSCLASTVTRTCHNCLEAVFNKLFHQKLWPTNVPNTVLHSKATFVSQAAVSCCRRLFSRKKAAQRAKRMAGQGLGSWGVTAPLIKGAPPGLRPPTHSRLSRRDSPTYDYHSRLSSSFLPFGTCMYCVKCCETCCLHSHWLLLY